MQARLQEVDKCMALAFLGVHGTVSQELSDGITLAASELTECATPRLTYRIFDWSNAVHSQLSPFCESADVVRLLRGCDRAVIFAVTLGASVDARLRRLQVVDMSRALLFDACANAAVETVCNNFCADVSARYGEVTPRFSPGYGDVPLSAQADLAKLLRLPETLGVHLTQSGLLVPQKTVTAIFGVRSSKTNCKKEETNT